MTKRHVILPLLSVLTVIKATIAYPTASALMLLVITFLWSKGVLALTGVLHVTRAAQVFYPRILRHSLEY